MEFRSLIGTMCLFIQRSLINIVITSTCFYDSSRPSWHSCWISSIACQANRRISTWPQHTRQRALFCRSHKAVQCKLLHTSLCLQPTCLNAQILRLQLVTISLQHLSKKRNMPSAADPCGCMPSTRDPSCLLLCGNCHAHSTLFSTLNKPKDHHLFHGHSINNRVHLGAVVAGSTQLASNCCRRPGCRLGAFPPPP